MDYIINPVLMGGLAKDTDDGMVKVNLHGRLGIICVPERLVQGGKPPAGTELEFYFSYLQVVDDPYDYDAGDMDASMELSPSLLGGKIIEENDTAIKVEVMQGLGTVAVPRRWVFTPAPLAVGQDVEFYFSCMRPTGRVSNAPQFQQLK